MGDGVRSRRLALWFALLLLPCILLARRVPFFIQPSIAGVIVWPLLPVLYLIPILAALHSLLADPAGAHQVLRLPGAWVVFACLGADLFVYILGAWKAQSAPLGVDLVLRVIPSMAAILIGMFMWKWRPTVLHGLVATSVIISAVAGLLQMSQRAGLDTLPGRWFLAWDTAKVSNLAMNYNRAQGLETNPNIYSPMAAVGVLWALFGMPKGPMRTATLGSSVVISVLSQSRTTMLVILGDGRVGRQRVERAPPCPPSETPAHPCNCRCRHRSRTRCSPFRTGCGDASGCRQTRHSNQHRAASRRRKARCDARVG